MQIPEMKSYLVSMGLLTNPAVILLGNGESNVNYLASDSQKKYVVRTPRADIPAGKRFEAERHYMLFIEYLGITFAPQSVLYDPIHNVHVISYVDGADASVIDLSQAQMSVFVRQLKRLNEITYDEYEAWCRNTGQSPLPPHTLDSRNKTFFEAKLQSIRDAAGTHYFARQVSDWATPKAAEVMAATPNIEPRLGFLHDDLRWNEHGGNLKLINDRIIFIDWELCGFIDRNVPEVGDILGSIPRTSMNTLAWLYRAYIRDEPDIQKLNNAISYGVRWAQLGNTLWAAERYFYFLKAGVAGAEEYRHMAERRMQNAKPYFEVPFEKWFL